MDRAEFLDNLEHSKKPLNGFYKAAQHHVDYRRLEARGYHQFLVPPSDLKNHDYSDHFFQRVFKITCGMPRESSDHQCGDVLSNCHKNFLRKF